MFRAWRPARCIKLQNETAMRRRPGVLDAVGGCMLRGALLCAQDQSTSQLSLCLHVCFLGLNIPTCKWGFNPHLRGARFR